MAESVVFSLACKILSTVASPAFQKAYEKGLSIWEARDELAKLQVTIETIQAVLLDAEKKQRSAAVKNWIKRLKGVLYDADDLFDEVVTDDLLKQQIMKGNANLFKKVQVSSSKLNTIVSRSSIAKKVQAIRTSLLDISADMGQFEFLRCQIERPVSDMRRGQDLGCFVHAKAVIGRDEDMKAILEMLFNESYDAKHVPIVISIVGIGGMGKTTLAQLLYNDDEVRNNFEKRWFACISDTFDEREVLGKIFQSIREGSYSDFNNSQLQTKIRESVKGKKYLLVLDDVWENHPGRWQDRMSLLSGGAKGSRILVTTRLSSVGNAMGAVTAHILEGLSENDSWKLFKRLAFDEEHEKDPRRESLGREILKRCRRVPLAIWTIGSLLHEKNTIQEWEAIEREGRPMLEDETMNVLKLSYDHLPSNLKQCFAYCALFPKDYWFEKQKLIYLWIAQGYIKPNNEESSFMHLLRRGFFQEAEKDDCGELKRCKMHDMMHDLALYVAGDETTMLSSTLSNTSNYLRHVSVGDSGRGEACDIPAPLLNRPREVKHAILRSFLSLKVDSVCSPTTLDQLFTNFKLLRTLWLKGLGIQNIPPSIGELKLMRYLDLSWNDFEELPDTMTNLVNLLALDLKCCRKLEVLPQNFHKLINLRYLNIADCYKLEVMPIEVGKLDRLQYLSDLKVGKGSELDALAELLQQLRGNLSLKVKDGIEDEEEDWNGDECKWQLPVSLHQLMIRGYPGIRIPDWGNNVIERTNNLARLQLFCCEKVTYLPPLWCLPNLRWLVLDELPELEFVQEEDNGSIFFPRLEELGFENLPKLKGWWRKVAAVSPPPQFPLLSQLSIRRCPAIELKSFPLCPLLRGLRLFDNNTLSVIQQQWPSTMFCPSTSPHLEDISIRNCNWVSSFQGESLASLRHLHIISSYRLTSLFLKLPQLQTVFIDDCNQLVSFELVEAPPLKLIKIEILNCKKLKILHIVSPLNALVELAILHCPELELWELQNKTCLYLDWDSLSNLRELQVDRLPPPEKLPHCLQHRQAIGLLHIMQSQLPKFDSSAAEEPKFWAWNDIEVPYTHAFLDNARKSKTNPSEPQMNRDKVPSQATKPKSPLVAKAKEGSEPKRAEESVVKQENTSVIQPSFDCKQGASLHRQTSQPAQRRPQLGTGNIGYKAMDKIKQRVCDVVSHKKNVEVLQTKTQVLMKEVAQVQPLRMSGGNDTKDEVHSWFAEASEILKDANGILEGQNKMVDKKRMCSTFCWDPTPSWETGEMLRGIDKILEKRKVLDLSFYCNKLQSRENKLQAILEALMDIHINMIGIYGMIGVGKTDLAKELARRALNNHLFDNIVMVQVSESVDVKFIQSQISDKIGLQLSEADDEETRAHLLYNVLEEKIMRGQGSDTEPVQQSKILVILDGFQCVIDLGKVGIPCGQEGRVSCKVVLISRNADVCKEMGAEKEFLVECLNLHEAKILFQEGLGDMIGSMEITLESERYQYVENVMLKKCRGLPLMINSLACALSSMSFSKWEVIADQLETHTLLEVDEVKEVPRAILELCNNFIQQGGKQKLFVLCCLIQKGVDARLEKLLRFGIGFGLFEVDSLASAVDQINSWVHELKSLFLLLETKKPHHFKLHDIIEDVVISTLSQGDYILPVVLNAGTCWHTREPIYENCVAISMMPKSNYKCLNDLELHKLQAFLLKGEPSVRLPDSFFRPMQNLKILDISRINILDFPSSIGDLKNLITLHLEFCDIRCGALSTICNLTTLEVLSLHGSSIQPFPAEIGNLTNLRVLDFTDCRICPFVADVITKLNHLKELYLNGNHTEWSTKLIHFPLEVLEIMMPKSCRVSPGALNFPNLRRFTIMCSDVLNYCPLEDFNSFSRVLLINKYDHLELEESGLRDLLSRTEFLHLKEVTGLLNGIGDLSIHGFLHLKNMHIERCAGIGCILDSSKLSLNQGDVFPELEILTLEYSFSLSSICYWQPCFNFFPKLRELRLRDLHLLSTYVLPVQLAVKLKIVEVSGCLSLLHIFASSDINDPSVELPCMERLGLEGLKSLLALVDLSEVSITRNELGRARRVLFSEKIKLPSLKEMHLENLHEFEDLWGFSGSEEGDAEFLPVQSRTYGKSPSFGNLKHLVVRSCGKLESLFPSRIVKSLSQLEKLEVADCRNMIEIITRSDMEDYSNSTTMIFPKLQTLTLKYLDRLQFFYRGLLLLKFPMLRELVLDNLRNMKGFTLQNTPSLQTEGLLFDGEIEFTSLEDLQVSRMNIQLMKRHEDTIIFPNLIRLTLGELRNLKSLPNINSKTLRFLDLDRVQCFRILFSVQPRYSMSLIMSCGLEELSLSYCNSLEELISDEKSDDNHQQLFSLRKLEVRYLYQLKRLPWNMVTNLRSLIIHDLQDWISLISTAMLLGGDVLHFLESIQLVNCQSLETIISQEELKGEDQDFIKYGVTLFPFLKKIELSMLPRLGSFSRGSYEAHFPSLETVEICECNSLQSFSMGPLRTPRLKSVKLDFKTMEADTFDDLNSVVAAAAEEKLWRRTTSEEAEVKRDPKAEVLGVVRKAAPDAAEAEESGASQVAK